MSGRRTVALPADLHRRLCEMASRARMPLPRLVEVLLRGELLAGCPGWRSIVDLGIQRALIQAEHTPVARRASDARA